MSLSGNGLAPPIMNYKSLFCLSKFCIAFGADKVEGRKSILIKSIWFCLTGSDFLSWSLELIVEKAIDVNV